MEEQHTSHQPPMGPIPAIFHSDKEQKPFTTCRVCGKNLMDCGEPYLIEKAFGKPEGQEQHKVIFELAYCIPCMQGMNTSLSEESRQNINRYFEEHTHMEERDANLKKYDLIDPEVWLHSCVVKNKSADQVNEFQIYGLCHGDQLIYNHAPYMICGEAIDEVMDLLSTKSLDILNDFMTDLIDIPPEFKSLYKSKTPLII